MTDEEGKIIAALEEGQATPEQQKDASGAFGVGTARLNWLRKFDKCFVNLLGGETPSRFAVLRGQRFPGGLMT